MGSDSRLRNKFKITLDMTTGVPKILFTTMESQSLRVSEVVVEEFIDDATLLTSQNSASSEL
jgi:hypothetical protein